MAAAAGQKENVYMVKLAEQAERYDEMVGFMEKATKGVEVEELTVEERKLIFVAYENVIGARRASWKIISSIEQRRRAGAMRSTWSPSGSTGPRWESRSGRISSQNLEISAGVQGQGGSRDLCEGILPLLDSHLIPSSTAAESKVFYLKMKGDYHRYLAEFKTGPERKEAAVNTSLAHKSGQDIAAAELAPMHPLRLGLANNFSLFYYEILNSPDRAYNLAKQAFDEASAEFDPYKYEMQLLSDNLTVWGPQTCRRMLGKRSKRLLSVRTGRNNSEM